MILGIGTDIVEIYRIKEIIKKWGGRFLERIYTEKEISYCYQKKDPFTHLAGRFAAKEAVIKAFAGINKDSLDKKKIIILQRKLPTALIDLASTNRNIGFKKIEICNDNYGRPFVVLSIPNINLEEIAVNIHLTISHEKNYAVAAAIIEIEDI